MSGTEWWQKPFPITSVCREDLRRFFSQEEIENFDDGDMEYLASKMSDAYCDCGYWDDLEIIGRYILDGRKEGGDK